MAIHTREVWDYNLQQEFDLIGEIIDSHPYVTVDTEFPGTVIKLLEEFGSIQESIYQNMRVNVNITKLIQVGLTISDAHGNLPTFGNDGIGCIWQFNFREFNIESDPCALDSIELLRKARIDIEMNRRFGVEAEKFAERLMSSGLILNENITWVAFHGSNDFGYLVKMLTHKYLPDSQEKFFDLVKVYFPVLYDVKHMIRYNNRLHGGLNNVAAELGIERFGICHQAGSDSLLTSHVFKNLKDELFNGNIEKYSGVLFGLGVD